METAEQILRAKLSEGWFEEDINQMKAENETRWRYTLLAMQKYAQQQVSLISNNLLVLPSFCPSCASFNVKDSGTGCLRCDDCGRAF